MFRAFRRRWWWKTASVLHCQFFIVSQRLFLKGIFFRFRHDNVTHGCSSSGKFRENWLLQSLEEVWEFYFESEKICIFERSQGRSMADLGKGPGGLAPSLPPPLLFWVKKKESHKKKSRQGRRQKTAPPPPWCRLCTLFLNSGQIPDHYILSLCNVSWSWFVNENIRFPFLVYISQTWKILDW